jgi:hypothetical protein
MGSDVIPLSDRRAFAGELPAMELISTKIDSTQLTFILRWVYASNMGILVVNGKEPLACLSERKGEGSV